MTKEKASVIAAELQMRISRARADLKEFSTKLEADPAYALSWGAGAFEAAASIKVYSQVLFYLNKGEALEDVKTGVLEEALRHARSPSRSTSPTANLMEQEEGCAWAILAELF